jgi:hypothetical protein
LIEAEERLARRRLVLHDELDVGHPVAKLGRE